MKEKKLDWYLITDTDEGICAVVSSYDRLNAKKRVANDIFNIDDIKVIMNLKSNKIKDLDIKPSKDYEYYPDEQELLKKEHYSYLID